MNLLLDTHALLWWLTDDARLSPAARAAVVKGSNVVVVSAASAWEIAIKAARGRLDAPGDLSDAIARYRFRPLAVTIGHALAAGELPPHHRDPFDRMLIAQAIVEGLTVVTRDPDFEAYGISLLPA